VTRKEKEWLEEKDRRMEKKREEDRRCKQENNFGCRTAGKLRRKYENKNKGMDESCVICLD